MPMIVVCSMKVRKVFIVVANALTVSLDTLNREHASEDLLNIK
jgi:hypothetical protein